MTQTVSVIIPTLNSERYLDECLAALRDQDYPRSAVELILVDGGSTDRTLAIAERYGVDHVLDNPRHTGEAGKAVGIHAATGELLCMIDSDNVIVGCDWLSRMVAPFSDPDVISSEALRWDYRRDDHFINRWQALTGVNDPLALFVGNYDRHSELTGRWTDYPHLSEPRDGWDKVTLHPQFVPTMGANGYIVRRSALDAVPVGDYLFDIDFVYDLVSAGFTTLARVDVAVRHYFCDSIERFYLKTRRRADDFFFFAGEGKRSYPWTTRQRTGVANFVLSTVLVLPVLRQASRGMRRRWDPGAWLFHVAACWITLGVYVVATIRGRVSPRMLDRSRWRQ